MGSYINYTDRIEITNQSSDFKFLTRISCSELESQYLRSQIVENYKIKVIQISEEIPTIAYQYIDEILNKRPDITLRIYGLYDKKYFDLSVLTHMDHLKRLSLEAHLRNNHEKFDFMFLSLMNSLRHLHLELFDLYDYSFLKHVTACLEELEIDADNMKGSIHFDCEWLLRFQNLHTLYLGKKAKKHIEKIAELPKLKNLKIRGIKLKSLEFLKTLNLESLSILYCGMNDLSQLKEFKSLKYLELWRILKLDDLSFVGELTNLEKLVLQDLNHIHELPDLSSCHHLKEIRFINVPIERVPQYLESIVKEVIHHERKIYHSIHE